MASTTSSSYESVLKFWFPEDKTTEEKVKLWFFGGPEVDQFIKDEFGDLVSQARDGKLSQWEDLTEGPRAGLAFIILIDQFCRNVYRGSPDQFSHDGKALAVTHRIISSGKDKELPLVYRPFLLLPLEHCEDMDQQNSSLQLFTEFLDECEKANSDVTGFAKQSLMFAKQHHEVISKYGRFPRRNKTLGRESTPEEIVALENWSYHW